MAETPSRTAPQPTAATSLTVFRPGGQRTLIQGADLSADVRDGCLVILNAGKVSAVLSPAQWISMNIEPIGATPPAKGQGRG
jgi:hypothetical protein